ncbi:flippase [Luteimonas sp. FXH3W]|uniref:Flippase n=1 Tax=Aquilutibacter rugosus TaxID=3115820 RepID=A0ABU7UW03_9GAMM
MDLSKLLPALVQHKIAARPGLARIIDNLGWLLLDKLLRMVGGLLVGVWVARYLGPEQFGLFNYASAFVVLFTAIAVLGLNPIIVRELVQHPEHEGAVLGTGFVLQLIGSLVALTLMTVLIWLLRENDEVVRYIVVIMGIGMVIKSADVIRYWFEAHVISRYTVWTDNAAFVLASVAKVYLILNGGRLVDFAWVALGEIVVATVLLVFVFLKINRQRAGWRVVKTHASALLGRSWPLLLSGLTITIYMKIDQIMLGQLADDREVGIFSAALRISEIWYFLPMIVVTSVYPSLLRSDQADGARFDRDMLRLLRALVVMALMVALPIWLLADQIIELLYGESFRGAAPVLAIHIWTSVFVFLGVAGGRWYVVKGLERLTFARTLLAACLNVALNLKLIPLWGAVGAAVASLVAQAMSGVLFNAFTARTRPLFFLQCRSLISRLN